MTRTAIDWSQKPEPWCWIGPQFKREVDAICNGTPMPPWPKSKQVTSGEKGWRIRRGNDIITKACAAE